MLMGSRIITLLCAALLVGGCGIINKTSRTSPVTLTVENMEEVQETRQDIRRERPRQERTQRTETRRQVPPPPLPVVRPEIRFSDAETQHVRLSAINPLPFGGIDLSLDELATEFCYPLQGSLNSDYGMRRGRMHSGIDIEADLGDTIRAAFPGVVRMAKSYSSYGNVVAIRHYNGLETVYSHNSKNLVKPNDAVEAGDPVSLAGRTGRASGVHLHFEVRAGGQPIDPKLVVDPVAMALRTGPIFIRNHNGAIVASTTEPGAQKAGEEALLAKAEYDTAREQALASSTVDGKPKGSSEPEKVYYNVKSGDSLSVIAQKYGTTVKKLCEMNNIKVEAYLQPNQRLRVK